MLVLTQTGSLSSPAAPPLRLPPLSVWEVCAYGCTVERMKSSCRQTSVCVSIIYRFQHFNLLMQFEIQSNTNYNFIGLSHVMFYYVHADKLCIIMQRDKLYELMRKQSLLLGETLQ